MLTAGDEVYGIITSVSEIKALVSIVPAQENGVRFAPSETAVIRVQDISERYVRTVKDELRTGDIVKARVSSTQNGVDLSVKGPEYGVIKAFCTFCRRPMALNGSKLICNKCERTETRKVSNEYFSNGE